MVETRLVTKVVFGGTELKLAIAGRDVDSVYKKAIRHELIRKHLSTVVFLFYSRKTGKLIDTRFN